ncbi:hypothetical protein SAMN05660866_02599 [Maribacter arcticus]|uniref:DUF481 domain-containing protein n=2 Tax=Maribacter arcticus TaxID=561365 RepID=A0A1T5D1J1_9FLAO|nr:hypothetical protein SAMN05660866_02599 [Maribacter arcticus]
MYENRVTNITTWFLFLHCNTNKLLMKLTTSAIKNLITLLLIFLSGFNTMAQEETESFLDDFRGTASVTNNGFSLVPSFSLGDPALLFDLKFTKKKLSFEPDMRFALEGKPWSFVFWLRYKAIENERFSLRLGAHPALNFRTVNIVRNGEPEELLETRRYLAYEVAPTFKVSDNVGLGAYYLYGHGFDEGVKNTHFMVLNSYFNNLHISEELYLNISPQAYYLLTDDLKGFYLVGFVSLIKKNFPFSVSAILNKAIDTEIVPEDDFTWNISLIYSFGGAHRRTTKRKI